MRVLLVHSVPLSGLGGAEISLRHHLARPPSGVRVDVILPDDPVELDLYQAVVLANLRPRIDRDLVAEWEWAERWRERIAAYRGWSIRSEHDIHPCDRRDARCVALGPLRRIPCSCSERVPRAFERLYAACSAVRFQSPAHRSVIRRIIRVEGRQFVIGAPVDFELFQTRVPYAKRRPAALVLGDEIRVASTAEERAEKRGFKPERIPYLSIPYEEMPALYNEYQAVVVDPVMFHAFGRVAVEAMACGCTVLASNRVGALSWSDPFQSSREANDRFWKMVVQRC